jgi:uroporphyrinogen-III decarboxylase
MDSREKIKKMFDHIEAPVPWVEIAVDEVLIAQDLGKPIPREALESILPFDVSWAEKVGFAKKVGLDALGIYHWEAYGSLKDETRPVLHNTPLILKRSDLPKLNIPDITLEDVYPEVKRASAAIGDTGIALYVEFATCLEFAISDMGFENLSMHLIDDPGFVQEVLDRYVAYASNLVSLYNRIPEIDFIWIGDDLAYKSGPFFSPATFRRYVFPHIRKVVQKIEKPWIFHSDGELGPLMEDILSWHPQAIHPLEGDTQRLLRYKRDYGQRVALVGNLSVDLLSRGSPEEVVRETHALLEGASAGGGYGFASGNSLARFVQLDNVYAVSKVIREFNRNRA